MIIAETTTAVDKTVDTTKVDTEAKDTNSKAFECIHCGVTKTKGKDNFRQAGSEWNSKTKSYDTVEKFIYWSSCTPCVDSFAKGKTLVS
tara:strand:- start:622 stop:888 length:267 start_codon:yes stop_codon:yes gene_type:complete